MGTLLDSLKIEEASGVDAGANLLDGWAMVKSREELDGILVEYEAASKAQEQLAQALEGALEYMKEAPDEVIEAARKIVDYLKNQGDTSEASKLRELIGKLRSLVKRDRTEEIDMTKEELTVELDARLAPIVKALEDLKTEPEVQAEPEVKTETEPETKNESPALSAEDLEGIITKAVDPLVQAIGAGLDRIEKIEDHLAGNSRSSIEGQDGEVEKKAPSIKDAITAALSGRTVELR